MTKYIPIYERQFDLNDWFVIAGCVILYSLLFLLPRRFPLSTTIVLLLFSATAASLFDNTIGAHIFDFYDIMDGPKYTIMDFVVYILYAPFGYLFIYFYDYFAIKGRWVIPYIVIWKMISFCFEWASVQMGVFHYKHGYQAAFSIPIYFLVETTLVLVYEYIKNNKAPAAR